MKPGTKLRLIKLKNLFQKMLRDCDLCWQYNEVYNLYILFILTTYWYTSKIELK